MGKVTCLNCGREYQSCAYSQTNKKVKKCSRCFKYFSDKVMDELLKEILETDKTNDKTIEEVKGK